MLIKLKVLVKRGYYPHSILSVYQPSKFNDATIAERTATPPTSVTGCLPELELDEMVYSDLFSIIGIFWRKGYNADYNLSTRQQADTLAFLSYIEKKLKPAILFALWMDPANYGKVTRPAYSKLYRWDETLLMIVINCLFIVRVVYMVLVSYFKLVKRTSPRQKHITNNLKTFKTNISKSLRGDLSPLPHKLGIWLCVCDDWCVVNFLVLILK